MNTKPKPKEIYIEAAAWLEQFDPVTETMTLVPTTPPGAGESMSVDCRLRLVPIFGSDPLEYEYICVKKDCIHECVLHQTQTQSGTVYWCECEPLAAGSAPEAGKA